MNEFRNARFTLDPDTIVPREVRERYEHLPETAIIRDREVDIEYDVDDPDGVPTGIARLRLPEKLARTLTEDELPGSRPACSVCRDSWPARGNPREFTRRAPGGAGSAMVS